MTRRLAVRPHRIAAVRGRCTSRALVLLAVAASSVTVLAATAGGAAAEPRSRGPVSRSVVHLAPVEPGQPSRALAAALVDVRSVRPRRLALTDLNILLDGAGANILDLLRLPDGVPADRRAAGLFRARLLAVIEGRIHSGGGAWCQGWRDGASRCALDCDGGAFLLRRDGSGGGLAFVLPGAGFGDASGPEGAVLNACDDNHRRGALALEPAGRGPAVIPMNVD